MRDNTTFRFSVGFFLSSCCCQLLRHSSSFVVFVAKRSSLEVGRTDQGFHHTSTGLRQSSSVQLKCCQNMFPRQLKATRHRNFINGVSRRRCNSTSHSGPLIPRQVKASNQFRYFKTILKHFRANIIDCTHI